ncbi:MULTISPECIES: TniQ family protein [unclassified Variovorax]|uniref:TniQ family protein n=1 Tax=unclassified Variovorax TaxID=663243 RepID=UPI000B87CAE0|nr:MULTISPECIES: TniQ family protein [unclassified Variovorax]
MASTAPLFDLPTTCTWLPGETLYSLCCRHHFIAGNTRAGETTLQLFGTSSCGPVRTGGVAALVERARGQLGNTRKIIEDRTLLPFHMPFLTQRRVTRTITAMSTGTPGGLKVALNALAGRSAIPRSLRACLACARADRAAHHIAYWHRDHQWPGVYRCPLHDLPLRELTIQPISAHGLIWCLPVIEALESSNAGPANSMSAHLVQQNAFHASYFTPFPPQDSAHENVIKCIASIAIALGTHGHLLRLEGRILSDVYRATLSHQGLLTAGTGHLRQPEAGDRFYAFGAALCRSSDFLGLLQNPEQANGHLLRLMKSNRMPRNPLWHLLAIAWLFEDWEGFMRQYHAFSSSSERRKNQLEFHKVEDLLTEPQVRKSRPGSSQAWRP